VVRAYPSAMKTLTAILTVVLGASMVFAGTRTRWSTEELATMRELSIDALEKLPADPTNKYADDPAAAALGKKIFFDTRFSSNGKVACATCHAPEKDFQDNSQFGHGVGVTGRRTMPIVGTAYGAYMFWDGRKDSGWSQALGPLESPVEHGGNRALYVAVMAKYYHDEYHAVFGMDHDTTRVFANMGKAIAAYERTLNHNSSRFDEYVRLGDGLNDQELKGLKLFMGKARCAECHQGPMLTDNSFHNIGIKSNDLGRIEGAKKVAHDEFNCLSKYSDAKPEQCQELQYIDTVSAELVGAFKTPSLRNVTKRAPYMHDGSLRTLDDVLDHYVTAPNATVGKSELKKVRLNKKEREAIKAFLRSLESEVLER
jgi:cytochrome c peroxidase